MGRGGGQSVRQETSEEFSASLQKSVLCFLDIWNLNAWKRSVFLNNHALSNLGSSASSLSHTSILPSGCDRPSLSWGTCLHCPFPRAAATDLSTHQWPLHLQTLFLSSRNPGPAPVTRLSARPASPIPGSAGGNYCLLAISLILDFYFTFGTYDMPRVVLNVFIAHTWLKLIECRIWIPFHLQ